MGRCSSSYSDERPIRYISILSQSLSAQSGRFVSVRVVVSRCSWPFVIDVLTSDARIPPERAAASGTKRYLCVAAARGRRCHGDSRCEHARRDNHRVVRQRRSRSHAATTTADGADNENVRCVIFHMPTCYSRPAVHKACPPTPDTVLRGQRRRTIDTLTTALGR